MSKRANLPYTYQDLFPHVAASPRDPRTPGSISGASFAESRSLAFTPRSPDHKRSNWKTMFRRLFKPRTLDFETAIWEVFYLIINPRKMYRTHYTYKHSNGKASSRRDDPSFLILVTCFLCISAIAWGLTYSPHVWDIIKLVVNMVIFDFYVSGVCVATVSWAVTNALFNNQFSLSTAFSASSRYAVNYIEWGFCFDIHCNSFLIIWAVLYLLQFFLLPLLTSKNFLSLLLGNTLYFGAVGQYFIITFYGFNSLPFVSSASTRGSSPGKVFQMAILAGILPLLALGWFLCNVFRFNVAQVMVHNYFN
ncbi:hypothetical protein EJF18_50431 [Clavispora lusitaniae]|uniref:Protein GMH1 n=3 Tax=Clavispora lusitaniae TaxID=36911 RepID=C4Y871_CLAL4|nr:uncharacterized protein CLUG_04399 [Clavispora lusitaniae ATCC 42720]KAF5209757.1 hypothetical protein E0198_004068 [Clavispora lusitaniae]EEQ40271.1 hypothetical protein CLUG_04399 [Clavispora lusitaniae ATCC 42720]KAF7581790.1 UNC-50 family protein [Clavispora lusitaniae]OVF09632.1 putative serine/threonine-protein phosphatase [Clavispora lusitaniae]QFZ29202.1 hypothetical protein EJF14_50431 [Clavispora lusitaniae]